MEIKAVTPRRAMHLLGTTCLIALCTPMLSPGQAAEGCKTEPLKTEVRLQTEYPDVLQALWDLGSRANICMAIETFDAQLAERPVKLSRGTGTAGALIRELLHGAPGYCLAAKSSVVSVGPCSRTGATWLDERIRTMSMGRSSLQSVSNGLYLQLRDQIRPMKGYGGHFPSGDLSDYVGPYHLQNTPVRQILNRLVADSKGALWLNTMPIGRAPRKPKSLPPRFWVVRQYADPMAGKMIGGDASAIRANFAASSLKKRAN
jgi:hypothetical protein